MVWYPGMEGGRALGDVLTGVEEPGGRLPFALPADEADLVPFDPDADAVVYGLLHGQWKLDRDGITPQRPFGAGLGYTTWALDPASIRLERGGPDATSGQVTVEVTNTGDRRGATVVLGFAGLPESTVERPPRRLVAFRRVALEAGCSTTVTLPFDLTDLAVRRDGTWFQEPGTYVLGVGTDAGDPAATVTIDVAGDI